MAGLALVIAVEFDLITRMGVFNPLCATYRLDHTVPERIARVLSAWSISSKAAVAAMIALWGLLASVTGPRTSFAPGARATARSPDRPAWRSIA